MDPGSHGDRDDEIEVLLTKSIPAFQLSCIIMSSSV